MAHGAARSRSYLGAQYHRSAARRGKKRTVVAVAHSILVIGYHVLRDGTTYREKLRAVSIGTRLRCLTVRDHRGHAWRRR